MAAVLQRVLGGEPSLVGGGAAADADLEFHADVVFDVRDRVGERALGEVGADRDDVVAADEEGERAVLLPEISHDRGVRLFDVDERVELVELIGVLAGRVDDVEVRDLEVRARRLREVLAGEHLDPGLVLRASLHLESAVRVLQRVDRSDFDAAWSSPVGFFGPLDRRRLVARGEPDATKAAAMRAGIRATADGLLDPADAYDGIADAGDGTNGLAGMRAMARELPEWPALEDASWCTRFAYQNVEKRGTGGSAFRGLFAPFVAEIEPELEAVDDAVVTEARGIDDDWGTVAQHLKQAGLADEPDESQRAYDAASEALLSVGDREEQLYERLLDRL